jgi:hypothetical protein
MPALSGGGVKSRATFRPCRPHRGLMRGGQVALTAWPATRPAQTVNLDFAWRQAQDRGMSLSGIARTLGRRGGLRRAQRLSSRRRAEIARLGARARAESLRLAEVIRNNFEYARVIERLDRPRPVLSETTCRGALPGIYGAQTKD